ncbi:hypothetical protein O0L34_g12013 [Tuta absoluta]|nr:hypothetical protein O0L34_g12013 [Tuta absoluta]
MEDLQRDPYSSPTLTRYHGGFTERSLFVINTYKVSWRIYREIPMYDGGFTERSLFALDIPAAQLFCTRLSCGLPAHCTLWRARGGARAPTVLHVYGGPEVQVVTNTYKVSWRIYREIPMYDGGFTERSLFALDIPAAQLFCTRLSCGLPAHCTLWRARGGARAPTVLHVYGGPEVQVVTNTYKVSWRIYREIPMYDGGFTERSLCIMEDLQRGPYL